MSADSERSRKTIPSAPMPVPRAQIAWITSGSVEPTARFRPRVDHDEVVPRSTHLVEGAPGRNHAFQTLRGSDGGVETPRHRPPSQTPDHPDGFAHDRLRHLARPFGPVDEHDRDLDDLEAAASRPGSSSRSERRNRSTQPYQSQSLRERDLRKHLKPPVRVPDLQPRYDPRIDVREIAQDEPSDRPVDDGHFAVAIARAEDEVGALMRLEELRAGARDRARSRRPSRRRTRSRARAPSESRRCRRCPAPSSSRALMKVDARVRRHDAFNDRRGAVRRAVVDDQYVERRILREHRIDEPCDVLAFVVRRDDDDRAPVVNETRLWIAIVRLELQRRNRSGCETHVERVRSPRSRSPPAHAGDTRGEMPRRSSSSAPPSHARAITRTTRVTSLPLM